MVQLKAIGDCVFFSDSTAKMRCRQRKVLFQKRNRVCDLSLLLAIVGLILIVIDAELTALNIINKVRNFYF